MKAGKTTEKKNSFFLMNLKALGKCSTAKEQQKLIICLQPFTPPTIQPFSLKFFSLLCSAQRFLFARRLPFDPPSSPQKILFCVFDERLNFPSISLLWPPQSKRKKNDGFSHSFGENIQSSLSSPFVVLFIYLFIQLNS